MDELKPYSAGAPTDELKPYSEFAQENFMPDIVSLEDLEEKIEQAAREEEADNIFLAEDKRVKD